MSENYLIIGDDEYLREKEIAKIKDKALSPQEAQLNFSVYSKDETGPMMDALGTAPFLSEKRVVLVRDIQDIGEKSRAAILSYLDRPSDTSVLVLTSDSEFRKTASYDKFVKVTREIRADRPKEGEIKTWVRGFFTREKIDISPDAVDMIVEMKGRDTAGLKSELEKLAVYSGGKRIVAEDVEKLVGRSMTETVFDVVDALEAKDAERVFRILGDLSDQKKHPVETIGYLAWHVRAMQKVCLLLSRGKSQEEILRELGMQRWRAMKLIQKAGKYGHSRIENWLSLLIAADRDIKTGLKSEDLALEMLVVGMMRT